MSNNNKEIYNQPITIKYSDDIELVQQVLNIYSKFVEYSLTPMYIDLMTYCIIDDMNSDDFKDNIIEDVKNDNDDDDFKIYTYKIKRMLKTGEIKEYENSLKYKMKKKEDNKQKKPYNYYVKKINPKKRGRKKSIKNMIYESYIKLCDEDKNLIQKILNKK